MTELFIAILLVAVIFGYLYFRPKRELRDESGTPIQQIELKLLGGDFTPSEISIVVNKPVRMVINRYDTDPADELFEIDELELYELLPSATTTIISFLPAKKGKFKIVLAGSREAGLLKVE